MGAPGLKDFLLPDLGEGLTEGEIVSWLVSVGDRVEVDQPLAEVETAKAVVEVPSPYAGTVTQLHGDAGDEVQVGKPLVTIDVGGGADTADQEQRVSSSPIASTAAPADPPPGEDAGTAARAPEDGTGSGNVLVGYGTAGRTQSRRGRADKRRGEPPQENTPERPLAPPPVRKMAKDLGIDLAGIRGSGPGGVIRRDDLAAPAAGVGEPEPAPSGQQNGSGAGAAAVPPSEDYLQLLSDDGHLQSEQAPSGTSDVERVPLTRVRRAIADKMTISRREIPEATTWVDCDATKLWELRPQLNDLPGEARVSPLAVIMRACVAALREYPQLNARFDADAGEIHVQRFVNLGFAADTPAGLVVPNIKRAELLSTLGLASELSRLAGAARAGALTPAEMTGGTFTLSNYGTFGVDGGSPVINHPEAAILGVGRIADRPWVHAGAVQVRKVLQLCIAFDHRICDGAEAAGFLRLVADCVEEPTTLLANL